MDEGYYQPAEKKLYFPKRLKMLAAIKDDEVDDLKLVAGLRDDIEKIYGKNSLNFELCNSIVTETEGLVQAYIKNIKAIAKYIAEFDECEEPTLKQPTT